jgi:hypothetical protein
MPTLPASTTTFPTAASIATPTTQPASLGGTAPGAGAGCVAAPIITKSQTITSGKCYSTLFTIPAAYTVTFGSGTANTFNFNAGLTVNGQAVFYPGKYGFSTPGVTTGSASTVAFNSGGAYNITNGAAFQISGTATFANGATTTYEFYTNGITINGTGTATFNGTDAAPASLDLNAGNLSVAGTLNLDPGAYYLATGTLTSTGTVNFASADSSSKYALKASSFSFGGPVTFAATAPAGIAFYGGPVTLSAGSAMNLPATNYCFAGGALTINRNLNFLNPGSGTTTINVPTGGISTESGTTLTFNDSSSSEYKINTGGTYAVTLSGTSSFGKGTYFFTNYNQSNCTGSVTASGGTGVAVNGNASFGGGIYSVQNGNFKIGSGTTSTFSAGTSCAPTSSPTPPAGACLYIANGTFNNVGTATFATGTWYLYEPGGSGAVTNSGTLTLGSSSSSTFYIDNLSGTFTNSGTATFGSGTYYFYDGSGGFTSSGTGAGALTFTGGSNSNYYFFVPSGLSGGTALDVAASANAVFNPATYYIVNGNLEFDSGATLSCPNCVVGGAGETFVLTGTGTGSTLTNNIGTLQVPNAITTTTLSAPGSGNYSGLLLYQDRNAPLANSNSLCTSGGTNCSTLEGGTNMDVTGVFYLPQGEVAFEGLFFQKSSGNCVVIVADKVTFLTLLGETSLTSTGCAAAGVLTLGTYKVSLTQ